MTKVNLEPPTVDHKKSGEESPIHVLHVDDEAAFLKCAKPILEMQGNFEVETASSVEEAMEKMEKKTFDVIVSDYIMPGKDGLEFLKELRDSRNSIPFIIFTGKGREIVAIKALNLGADQYINKIGKPETVYGELAHSIIHVMEKQRSEQLLEESEEKIRKIFESSPDAITVTDLKGNITGCNEATINVYGFSSKEEIIGRNAFDFFPKREQKRAIENLKRTISHGSIRNVEYINLTKEGKEFPIELSANIIKDSSGNPVAFVAIIKDITERKNAESVLRRSEEGYRILFESSREGILVSGSDGRIVSANPATVAMLGYNSPEELVGLPAVEVYYDPEARGEVFRRMREQGHIENYELVFKKKDGSPIQVLLSAIVHLDADGDVLKAEAFFSDISDRKRMENKLLQQNEFLNSALDALTHPFYVIDADDYTIQLANSATGFDILAENRTCYQVTHKRKKPCSAEHPCPLEIVKKTRKPAVTEHIHYDKNGNERNVEVHGYPIFGNDGNIVQMIESNLDITERKKAEEALRASEEKFRELLNGMNDTVWVIDFDGTIIDVNDAAVEVLGYSREELRSIGLTGIDSNLDPEKIKGPVEGMPADEIQVFETAHTTKDGKKIPVEISSSLVTYHGKQAILSIARNITERKRAEEKLRQSEERYRTVFENTGTAMCILEEDKTISMVNRRFEELSGYSWEELEGKKWTELVTKEYLERMKRYHEARRKKGRKAPKHYNFDFVNKKGQIINCLLAVNLIPGTKKSIASILDITEQKKTEKALREAEEKYQETIVNANVGIICYSPDGEVKVLNPKMDQMTGFKRSEIPTLRAWFKKLYPNKEERHKIRDKWFKRMSEEGEVKKGHAIITTKDGKRRNFLFNGVQLESGDSIAFADDITERKEAEEKLDEMMNEVVAINEKLGVVGRLTRHDVRNKLSAVTGNIYLAKQALPPDSESVKYLNETESAVDQIEQIFDFARTYEQLGVEDLSYVDVEKSFEVATSLLSDLHGIEVVNDCKGLSVLADSLLAQLFYNLMDNSIRHGEKVNRIRIHHKVVKDGLKLVYEDNGVGVPKAEKEKIFTKGYGKGTGIGLHMMKIICKVYGWTIQETGKQGKGAQFTMTIPKTNKSGKTAYQLH